MKKESPLSLLSKKMEQNKIVKYCVYGALFLCVIIIFISSLSSKAPAKSNGSAETAQQNSAAKSDTEKLEARLEEILSGMRGVGKVRVMVVFEGTEEVVIASDESESKTESGSSKTSRPATVTNSGSEAPIVVTEENPKVVGVIVVAEGAGDIGVNYNIVSAVSTVLGINKNKVQAFEMNN